MSSIYGITLCLITLSMLASCATTTRSVAQESEVKRAPDYRFNSVINKQIYRDRN